MAKVKLTSKTKEIDKLMGSQEIGIIAMPRYLQFFIGVESKGSVDTSIAEDS